MLCTAVLIDFIFILFYFILIFFIFSIQLFVAAVVALVVDNTNKVRLYVHPLKSKKKIINLSFNNQNHVVDLWISCNSS